eukprot:ANDGO_05900.mRNA.1 hypothetical protein
MLRSTAAAPAAKRPFLDLSQSAATALRKTGPVGRSSRIGSRPIDRVDDHHSHGDGDMVDENDDDNDENDENDEDYVVDSDSDSSESSEASGDSTGIVALISLASSSNSQTENNNSAGGAGAGGREGPDSGDATGKRKDRKRKRRHGEHHITRAAKVEMKLILQDSARSLNDVLHDLGADQDYDVGFWDWVQERSEDLPFQPIALASTMMMSSMDDPVPPTFSLTAGPPSHALVPADSVVAGGTSLNVDSANNIYSVSRPSLQWNHANASDNSTSASSSSSAFVPGSVNHMSMASSHRHQHGQPQTPVSGGFQGEFGRNDMHCTPSKAPATLQGSSSARLLGQYDVFEALVFRQLCDLVQLCTQSVLTSRLFCNRIRVLEEEEQTTLQHDSQMDGVERDESAGRNDSETAQSVATDVTSPYVDLLEACHQIENESLELLSKLRAAQIADFRKRAAGTRTGVIPTMWAVPILASPQLSQLISAASPDSGKALEELLQPFIHFAHGTNVVPLVPGADGVGFRPKFKPPPFTARQLDAAIKLQNQSLLVAKSSAESSGVQYTFSSYFSRGKPSEVEDRLLVRGLMRYGQRWDVIHEKLLPIFEPRRIAGRFKALVSARSKSMYKHDSQNLVKQWKLLMQGTKGISHVDLKILEEWSVSLTRSGLLPSAFTDVEKEKDLEAEIEKLKSDTKMQLELRMILRWLRAQESRKILDFVFRRHCADMEYFDDELTALNTEFDAFEEDVILEDDLLATSGFDDNEYGQDAADLDANAGSDSEGRFSGGLSLRPSRYIAANDGDQDDENYVQEAEDDDSDDEPLVDATHLEEERRGLLEEAQAHLQDQRMQPDYYSAPAANAEDDFWDEGEILSDTIEDDDFPLNDNGPRDVPASREDDFERDSRSPSITERMQTAETLNTNLVVWHSALQSRQYEFSETDDLILRLACLRSDFGVEKLSLLTRGTFAPFPDYPLEVLKQRWHVLRHREQPNSAPI